MRQKILFVLLMAFVMSCTNSTQEYYQSYYDSGFAENEVLLEEFTFNDSQTDSDKYYSPDEVKALANGYEFEKTYTILGNIECQYHAFIRLYTSIF